MVKGISYLDFCFWKWAGFRDGVRTVITESKNMHVSKDYFKINLPDPFCKINGYFINLLKVCHQPLIFYIFFVSVLNILKWVPSFRPSNSNAHLVYNFSNCIMPAKLWSKPPEIERIRYLHQFGWITERCHGWLGSLEDIFIKPTLHQIEKNACTPSSRQIYLFLYISGLGGIYL